ncbi:hypothetical protein [Amycolatopsis thermoflava]|uniref:hypothetical protein n=1 Tax=Amycolatopsis thermoflava TaxID=84480 RepID=UPI003F4A3929
MVTARFGQMAVEFVSGQDEPSQGVVFQVAPVLVSEDHLVAALWYFAAEGVEAEDLADTAYVREVAADVIVNAGWCAVAEACARLRGLDPGSAEHGWAEEIRGYVRRAFADVLGAYVPRPRTTARRGLAPAR